MSRAELLTVEDCFEIRDLGVVLRPDFSVPKEGWKARSDTVTVIRPDGQQFDAIAEFNPSHLNIPDPSVSMERRWRVIVSLPGCRKDQLPVGTKILISQAIRDALFPKSLA